MIILSSQKNIGNNEIREIAFSYLKPILHLGHFPKELLFWWPGKIPNTFWSLSYPYLHHFHQEPKFHSSNFEHIIQLLFLDLFWCCEATIFYIASKYLKLIQDLTFPLWCDHAKIHIILSSHLTPTPSSSFLVRLLGCKGSTI